MFGNTHKQSKKKKFSNKNEYKKRTVHIRNKKQSFEGNLKKVKITYHSTERNKVVNKV